MKRKYYIILLLCLLNSCKNRIEVSPVDLFSITANNISEMEYKMDEDSIGTIEGVQCYDSTLVVFDYHLGKSFTLFDFFGEKYVGRFGLIGQGPGEIPLGCYGNMSRNEFDIFYNQTGLIAKYNVDSLTLNINTKPQKIMNYKIPEAIFSRVIPVNDTVFLGAGIYKSKYQFVLFDRNSKVLDYGVEIFNAQDKNDNMYHKYLSNQGTLKKSPVRNQYVYSINNSSNIDFINITNHYKIELMKSIRLRNPKYKAITDGRLNRVVPDDSNAIGYIDLAVGDKYVYALYTDNKIIDEGSGKGNAMSSNLVLVFDWQGNPVKMYALSKSLYYIAVNEFLHIMYGATMKKDGGWTITSYAI